MLVNKWLCIPSLKRNSSWLCNNFPHCSGGLKQELLFFFVLFFVLVFFLLLPFLLSLSSLSSISLIFNSCWVYVRLSVTFHESYIERHVNQNYYTTLCTFYDKRVGVRGPWLYLPVDVSKAKVLGFERRFDFFLIARRRHRV